MITIHHLIVGRSLFTVWLLEELELEYELVPYERLPTRRAPAALKDVHPLGKSPVIVDDGLVIAESGAIAAYLLERYDPEHRLAPPVAERKLRARFLQWLHYPEGSAFLPLSYALLQATTGQKLPEAITDFVDGEIRLHLSYMASGLGDQPYILGESFSAADIGLGYITSLADRLELLGDSPTLQDYLERARSRPAFRRAHERSGG